MNRGGWVVARGARTWHKVKTPERWMVTTDCNRKIVGPYRYQASVHPSVAGVGEKFTVTVCSKCEGPSW